MVEHIHQNMDDADDPVTRRECYLHRELIDRRVGGVERDIIEMKGDLRGMKEAMEKFYDAQEGKWTKLWYALIVIALLIAAGRVFDVENLFGLM